MTGLRGNRVYVELTCLMEITNGWTTDGSPKLSTQVLHLLSTLPTNGRYVTVGSTRYVPSEWGQASRREPWSKRTDPWEPFNHG